MTLPMNLLTEFHFQIGTKQTRQEFKDLGIIIIIIYIIIIYVLELDQLLEVYLVEFY